MNIKHQARILILEDDLDLSESLRSMLIDHFTEVVAVDSYAHAILHMERNEVDVLISAYQLRQKNGLDIRNWQLQNKPDCYFILLTGYAHDPKINEHLMSDHFLVLQKPAHPNELVLTLRKYFPNKKSAA